MTAVDETQGIIVCPTCGKTFESLMAYRGHQGFHKLDGVYPCEICAARGEERLFSLPQGLGAHKRAKHGIPGKTLKIVRKRANRAGAQVDRDEPAPARAVDVPLAVADLAAPVMNGPDPIEKEIREALTPLIERYERVLARQQELNLESVRNSHDLGELWDVLQVVATKVGVQLPPPPGQGVQVAFTKRISDSLQERAEEWLTNRRNSFTTTDLARGVGCGDSTAAHIIVLFRDQGKLRLVGKRGHAKTYLSTISAR